MTDITSKDKTNLNNKLDEFARVLEHLAANHKDFSSKVYGDKGFVIAINGKYGTGKTTFIDYFSTMIEDPDLHYNDGNHGRKKNHVYKHNPKRTISRIVSFERNNKTATEVILIKYNAWENDYFDDPFVSLVGQICHSVKDLNSPTIEGLRNTAKEVVKAVGKVIGNTIGNIQLFGLNAVDIIEEGKKLADTINAKKFDAQVDAYTEIENAKHEFKTALSTLGSIPDNNNPLKIIFIDELDRCNPSFAIKLLERIKHFFNAENTLFVLTIDKVQFINIIKKVYGHDFDAQYYLSRFFDFELQLPQGEDFYKRILTAHCDGHGSQIILGEICKLFDFKPREQIKFYKLAKFAQTMQDWNIAEYYILLGLYLSDSALLNELQKFNHDIGAEINVVNVFSTFMNATFNNKAKLTSAQIKKLHRSLYNGLWRLFILTLSSNNEGNSKIIKQFIQKHEDTDFKNYQSQFSDMPQDSQNANLEDLLAKVTYFC